MSCCYFSIHSTYSGNSSCYRCYTCSSWCFCRCGCGCGCNAVVVIVVVALWHVVVGDVLLVMPLGCPLHLEFWVVVWVAAFILFVVVSLIPLVILVFFFTGLCRVFWVLPPVWPLGLRRGVVVPCSVQCSPFCPCASNTHGPSGSSASDFVSVWVCLCCVLLSTSALTLLPPYGSLPDHVIEPLKQHYPHGTKPTGSFC